MATRLVVPFEELDPSAVSAAGGKACALAALSRAGLPVPAGAVVTTAAYRRYVSQAGLRERIALELSRKDFADMRWEELWDAALRIRGLFLTNPLPATLGDRLARELGERLLEGPVVVRSSAPGEDAAGASFAGLHESYVNVSGRDAVLEHIRLVWASLWSDAALLYRRELGLDPRSSAMAVVVQELVVGQRSGVCFTVDPRDARHGLVEAVHGLNQGLVDGTVEPDRWVVDREEGRHLEHAAAEREEWVQPTAEGVAVRPLPSGLRGRPPLTDDEAEHVYAVARRSESHFGRPQDVEWTFVGESLRCLQSRPVTTGEQAADDRAAYLALHRSFENLRDLRTRIEDELLPALGRETDAMAAMPLAEMADEDLLSELHRRRQRYEHWIAVYSVDFIPFAHGVRLFGRFYNDTVRPDDPFQFTDLLSRGPMASLDRNRALDDMAAILADGGSIEAALDDFLARYGDTSWGATTLADQRATVAHLVAEMAARSPATETAGKPSATRATAGAPSAADGAADRQTLEERFLELVSADERDRAREMLDLARASWRLRDDDNIYVGRLEGQLLRVAEEAGRRGLLTESQLRRLSAPLHPTVGGTPTAAPGPGPAGGPTAATQGAVSPASDGSADGESDRGREPGSPDDDSAEPFLRARQLIGQPAGPGIAVGPARIVLTPADIGRFRAGEVMVCDAVDPSMTLLVPLAAAIVERRGGMLIHGAIIAREYGIPCVTGVPRVTELIATGDRVSVDGHLGIVIVG